MESQQWSLPQPPRVYDSLKRKTTVGKKKGYEHACKLTGARTIHLPDYVCHAGFVAHEGSQVGRFARVIFGERLDFAAMALATLARQEPKGAVTRSGELPMRLRERDKDRVRIRERTRKGHKDAEKKGSDRILVSLTILPDPDSKRIARVISLFSMRSVGHDLVPFPGIWREKQRWPAY